MSAPAPETLSFPGTEAGLARVLNSLFSAVAEIAVTLRSVGGEAVDAGDDGSSGVNAFGDRQLKADVAADTVLFQKLRECGAVEIASSEENTAMVPMGGSGYSVAFDPVDGSSIYPANWSVGTIFGIWPGGQLLGRCGQDQVAAGFSVFGPRTVIVIARPSGSAGGEPVVEEYTLLGTQWTRTCDHLRIPANKKTFAPANLRAASDNSAYHDLMLAWMADKYSLRYSGGLVPDVYHIFAKGGGVFCNPVSPSAPAKLRLLYEVAPLAFVVEAAGGASHNGSGSALLMHISSAEVRSQVALGSRAEVDRCLPALKLGGTA